MSVLAAMTWEQMFITFIFVCICVFLVIVVLLQKGRGGGLSGAFGGVGGHSAFGTKTGDVFTWITVVLAFLFFIVAIIGNYRIIPVDPMAEAPPAEVTDLPPDAGDAEEAPDGQ